MPSAKGASPLEGLGHAPLENFKLLNNQKFVYFYQSKQNLSNFSSSWQIYWWGYSPIAPRSLEVHCNGKVHLNNK